MGVLEALQGSRSAMVPELDDFPTNLSIQSFLQEFFGVLEFPATTTEIANYFAVKAREDHAKVLAA